jgi:ADP-heptose:LPS heptosyltransferase
MFRQILIVRAGGIGDAVLVTPIFSALKKQFPQTHLAYMTKSSSTESIKELPFIDEIIELENNRNILLKIKDRISLIKKINKFDAVFFLMVVGVC